MEKIRFSWSRYSNDYKCSHPGDMAGNYCPAEQVYSALIEKDVTLVKLAEAQSRIRKLEHAGRHAMDVLAATLAVYNIALPLDEAQAIAAFERELDKEVFYWNAVEMGSK